LSHFFGDENQDRKKKNEEKENCLISKFCFGGESKENTVLIKTNQHRKGNSNPTERRDMQ
jgi:hypothetical protein